MLQDEKQLEDEMIEDQRRIKRLKEKHLNPGVNDVEELQILNLQLQKGLLFGQMCGF